MKKSFLLVIVQFSCIGYFILFNGVLPNHLALIFLEGMGVFIGLWAIQVMGMLNLTIFPEPKSTSTLLERGPYRWVRHPMYTAVIAVCLALALDAPSWLDILVLVILIINQWIKLRYEEGLLEQRFETYSSYKQRTKALIPFIL